MPNRHTLHKAKLEDFQHWLTTNSIKWRKTDHDWQVLQIRARARNGHMAWIPIFDNLRVEHLTVPDVLSALVHQYILDVRNR